MRQMLAMVLMTALLGGAGACKKDEASGGGSAAKPTDKAGGGGGGKKDLGAPTWKKFDKMGLQVELPASAEFMDTSADAPGGQYFTGNNECSVRVNETTLAYTDDFDRAKAEVEKDPSSTFKKWVKAEKTADGWAFQWEAESAIEPGKKQWGIQYRKKIGEKQYECWEKVDNAESAACSVHACESLKAI